MVSFLVQKKFLAYLNAVMHLQLLLDFSKAGEPSNQLGLKEIHLKKSLPMLDEHNSHLQLRSDNSPPIKRSEPAIYPKARAWRCFPRPWIIYHHSIAEYPLRPREYNYKCAGRSAGAKLYFSSFYTKYLSPSKSLHLNEWN